MKQRKTHKKFRIIAGIFILLIGVIIGGYLVLESKTGSASISQILGQGKEKIAACSPEPNNKNKDSDNDGLNDWEEAAWKTDSCRPDTDGDGYLDGEEVLSDYDPLKPAPGDELPNHNPDNPRSLPGNLTRALSQELAKKILDGKIEPLDTDTLGLSPNENNYAAVSAAIQETINNSLKDFSLPDISDTEIKISGDNSWTAVDTYSKQIVAAIKNQEKKAGINQETKFEFESQLFFTAVNDNNFDEINKYINFYQGVYQDIKQISVPSDFKDIHKEQLGIFWVTSNIAQAVKSINEDPIKASLALEQYKIINEMTDQMINKIINRLQEH